MFVVESLLGRPRSSGTQLPKSLQSAFGGKSASMSRFALMEIISSVSLFTLLTKISKSPAEAG